MNCYAEAFAERWRGTEGHPYEHGFDLRLVEEKLYEPLTWAKSRMIFVNSMSDLFHEEVPDSYIVRVFRVMQTANWHVFQVLTKRPGRLLQMASKELQGLTNCQNIWLGVSVENRLQGIPRIDLLKTTPASIRFLSVEPLLENLGELDLRGIDWIIVGGESGAKARPMLPDWVRGIRDQCSANGTRFFFKQWGGRNKKAAGRDLDGKTYEEFPHIDIMASPSRSERKSLLNDFSKRDQNGQFD
jgi:protein gp37